MFDVDASKGQHSQSIRESRPGRATRGRVAAWAIVTLLAVAASSAGTGFAAELPPPGPVAIVRQIDAGQFAQAEQAIATGLAAPGIDATQRDALEFQRERMRRIRLDFKLDEAAVLAQLRKQIPDLKPEEFAAWDGAGEIERMTIDGQKRYFNRSVSNFFRTNAQAAARRAPPVKPNSEGPYESLNPYHAEALNEARATGKTSVAPRRLQVTQSLTVDADAVPAGETVRAWIPYPQAIAGQQENIRFISSSTGAQTIAPESAPMRTVYQERKAVAGQPTTFSITYEVTIYGRKFLLDENKVVASQATPELAPYLGERGQHIVFTDDIKRFSAKVVGDEKNPYRIAQKMFDAVDQIPWGGAREYSTITNISDYALHAGHADCGQQTLLLMTLLRYNGIPARWQSGWTYSDESVGYDNMHDWGWMYLAPYGWVPMDVTTGRLNSDDAGLRDYYFGGLDAYRISFNNDFSQPLVPGKQHARSETVDSQRGEAEWPGGNLYFDQWDYRFEWKMLPLAQDAG